MSVDEPLGLAMDQTGRILQLIGTFLPVYGIVLTAIFGVILKRWWRAAALLLTPLLTYWLGSCWGGAIAFDGNMLFVALFGVFMLGLCIYYPVLLVVGIILWFKKTRCT